MRKSEKRIYVDGVPQLLCTYECFKRYNYKTLEEGNIAMCTIIMTQMRLGSINLCHLPGGTFAQ